MAFAERFEHHEAIGQVAALVQGQRLLQVSRHRSDTLEAPPTLGKKSRQFWDPEAGLWTAQKI